MSNPLKHSISSGSVKKSNVQALHSLFEKMNSAKIFSLLSEIRKKPFLQRSPLDLKRESILSTMMNEYIFKARIKYTSKK
ncbi:MAG: hypothetical protein CMC04_04520 [Flavobacteriaceae bacterium]|nr:hypothetical protein [Flavobacteriaceae bacterium]|tara:strand:+ start:799 stop:1038 length:240 start_codon:yes stop_codon:yes gene_type:complete